MGCNCKELTNEEVLYRMDDQRKPFTEVRLSSNEIIRTFDSKYPDHLFKWHFDEEDRIIEALEDSDWRFQYDNEMPTPLLTGISYKIPKGMYHRIIKGSGTVKIKINLKPNDK